MGSKRNYIPERGDVVWVDFDPTAGHEQSGHRPALVISPAFYNKASGLCVAVPITQQQKGYSFEIPLTVQNKRAVALADHVRSVDWNARRMRYIETIPSEKLYLVQQAIVELIVGV